MDRTSKRILIVEDEFLIAVSLEEAIRADGHEVVGPAASLAQALQFVENETFHVAILNLLLKGEPADPVCERLAEKGVPFAFASAIHADWYDGRWKDRPRITKPYAAAEVRDLLLKLLPA